MPAVVDATPPPPAAKGLSPRVVSVLVAVYGLVVAAGGVAGYLTKGSIPSLVAGGGFGLALVLLAPANRRRVRGPAAVAVMALLLAVAAVMAELWIQTGSPLPAAPLVFLSLGLALVVFGSWRAGGTVPSRGDGPAG
jgi:uncharacterized membrane protein (UPF0136 family)